MSPTPLVDLHCHLLPAFAGGPVDFEAAVQRVVKAASAGVVCMVATPRYGDTGYRAQGQRARAQLTTLEAMLTDRGALVQIVLAAECRFGQALMQAIVMNEVPYVGNLDGERVVLVTLPETRVPENLLAAIPWMRAHKVRPLIAAPERNRAVLHDIEVLAPVFDAGALFEVSAAALAGRLGPYSQQRARQMLERGWVEVITSNAHASHASGAELHAGAEAAAVIVGDAAAADLVWSHPARMVAPHLLRDRRRG